MVYVKATVLLRNWSCGIYNISLLKEHNEPITALVTEGNICVTGSRNGICKIWDTSSLTSISSLTGHTDEISTISIKDGLVITGCSDGVVRVFSAMTSQCLWCLTTTSSVDVITYNGSVIVAATSDLSLYVWTLDKCHPTLHGTLQGHTQQLTCLVMSCSESNICVSGSWDGTLRIWDTKRMMNCHVLLAHDEGVLCVLVLSNGTIVSGGSDCTVKQWNISNGHLIMTLSGHKQEVLCLQATDDVIISSSADSTIRIWNYEGKCVNVLSEHIGLVRCLRINGDDVLVSGGDRKKINVWSIKVSESDTI
jgi:F-box/WD-40 domain protein 7